MAIATLIAAAGLAGCTSPLVRPALTGDVASARVLLDAGEDPNGTDRKKRSALELAVLKRQAGMVQLLLERGANPNIVGPYHKTPLQHAVGRGSAEIAGMLIRAGADVSVRGRGDATLLIDAVYVRNAAASADLVEALIRGGSDLNAVEPRRAGGTRYSPPPSSRPSSRMRGCSKDTSCSG
jgi:ankyrin repeat protein